MNNNNYIMSSNRHNKKRNVGLIYELLVKTISEAIVENNDDKKNKALFILKKYYNKNSEIYKEFRLFHSLVSTNVLSESVADSILGSAKKVSQAQNYKKLDKEKSFLIKDINYNLNEDQVFYDKKIDNYTIYATIQTLLNEWKNEIPSDIVRLAQYEDILKKWLLEKKDIVSVDSGEECDPLVEKLMIKKFNERYGKVLTKEQSDLIKDYIFSNDENSIKEKIKDIKDTTINKIDEYLKQSKNKNDYINKKLEKAKSLIESTSIDKIDDEKVERFLDVAKLLNELKSDEI